MKNNFKALLLLVFNFFFTVTLAQTSNVRATIDVLQLQSISLNDADITNPQNAPVYFFVNVYNDNTTRNIKIVIDLSSQTRSDIGKLSMTYNNLSPNAVLRLTNRNFTGVDLNGIIGQQFLKAVENTGTFPPDQYYYNATITDVQGNVLATAQTSLTVTNPISKPELITPGANFNTDIQKVYTPFPMFQWFGQVNKYDFAIYEVMPNQTPEDVVRNIAQFKTTITSTNFLYPNYAEKLANGKIYAWQILGEVTTANGVQYLPSEVFRFQYVDLGKGGSAQNISKIQVTPQEIELAAQQQFQFSALYYDNNNNQVLNVTPQWSVTPSDKGTITQTGLFTAGSSAGTVAVIVNAGAANDFSTVTITSNAAASSSVNVAQWEVGTMLKQLFGLPN